MRGGTLIIIGTVALVVGLVPPFSVLCVVCGITCIGFGVNALQKESEEKPEGKE